MTITELFALEPRLQSIIESAKIERVSTENPWLIYERAKRAAAKYVGYDAEEKALRLPAAYDYFCRYLSDILSL